MGMIIEKQTAAKTHNGFTFGKPNLPATVHVAGLLVAETIAVNVVDESGAALPLYDLDGVAVVLSVSSQPLAIDSPIKLQFVKPETANAVGLQLVI